jgi:methyl-accepting chemotaxis protein
MEVLAEQALRNIATGNLIVGLMTIIVLFIFGGFILIFCLLRIRQKTYAENIMVQALKEDIIPLIVEQMKQRQETERDIIENLQNMTKSFQEMISESRTAISESIQATDRINNITMQTIEKLSQLTSIIQNINNHVQNHAQDTATRLQSIEYFLQTNFKT